MLVVMLAEQVKVGGIKSWTVTVKLQVPEFPLESFAVQVTTVAPRLKVEPLAGEQVVFVTAQLSVEVTVKFTF